MEAQAPGRVGPPSPNGGPGFGPGDVRPGNTPDTRSSGSAHTLVVLGPHICSAHTLVLQTLVLHTRVLHTHNTHGSRTHGRTRASTHARARAQPTPSFTPLPPCLTHSSLPLNRVCCNVQASHTICKSFAAADKHAIILHCHRFSSLSRFQSTSKE